MRSEAGEYWRHRQIIFVPNNACPSGILAVGDVLRLCSDRMVVRLEISKILWHAIHGVQPKTGSASTENRKCNFLSFTSYAIYR